MSFISKSNSALKCADFDKVTDKNKLALFCLLAHTVVLQLFVIDRMTV